MSLDPKKDNSKDSEDDSDESDEDYVPKELDNDSIETKKKVIQTRTKVYEVEPTYLDTIEPIKPDDKKKSDDLWSEFMKDVKQPEPQKPQKQEAKESDTKTSKKPAQNKPEKLANITRIETSKATNISELFSRSSEVSVTNKKSEPTITKITTAKGSDKLSSILARINKEPKVSTLQKSLQDWNEFKQDEEIEDELEIQNKSKNSYLDRKAFLERTDLREFEIEKNLRNAKRLKKSS